nr:hypothetical protein GCM10020063_090730 [Dactylosporangium thailandense]
MDRVGALGAHWGDGQVLHHWWNGSWGRLNRRDVYVRSDGDQFELELRLGGSEGRQWRRTYDTYQNPVPFRGGASPCPVRDRCERGEQCPASRVLRSPFSAFLS